MSAHPATAMQTGSLSQVPGARLHCALLTLLTVTLAAATGSDSTEAALRPLFFALLYSFLRQTGALHPGIRTLPLRLCEAGFLVLTLASAGSAVLLLLDVGHGGSFVDELRRALDHGALFLLGNVLVAYGLMLWIPLVLHQRRELEKAMAKTQGELLRSETERSDIEDRLIEAQRLGILGELAAGVAHDLRNPLTIIRGAADAMTRRERSPESLRQHAAIIQRGVEKADRTIQALLDLGRGKPKACASVELQPVLQEAAALVEVEARRKSLRLVVQAHGAAAYADRDLLLQALLNLLLNAAHACQTAGCIDLRARPVRTRSGDWIAIAVEDRGAGLLPEVRKRAFTPFFTTREGGTGLGLLSSRRIAQQLGGALGLYPRTNGGARALLLLPADGSTASRPSPAVDLALVPGGAP